MLRANKAKDHGKNDTSSSHTGIDGVSFGSWVMLETSFNPSSRLACNGTPILWQKNRKSNGHVSAYTGFETTLEEITRDPDQTESVFADVARSQTTVWNG